jgi:acetyltransferase-like isoleucine patch superfamily enzyme
MLLISPSAKVSKLADIEDSVLGSRIVIGDDVVIDSFVRIKPAGGIGDIEIGKNSYINSGTVMYSGNGIKIGAYVLIAANCTFAPSNHEFKSREQLILSQRFKPSRGGIVVEDDVWIGANCVLLDGAMIRRGAVVGAGSIVRSELEEYGVYGGNPIRLLKRRGE